MIKRKTKRMSLSVTAVICCVAVCLAAGTLSGSSRAFALDEPVFRADFENLNTGSTADEIYANTGFAGSIRSIEASTRGVYIEAPYTFWDNGCQKASLYLDSKRGVSSTDVSKSYTFRLEFMDYGLVSSTVLQLQGNETAKYNSVVTFTPDGKGVISNYGSEQYVKDITAERAEDGWWNATFTVMGTGGYIFPNFCMNTSDYNTANSEKNTGLRLGGFKVTEGENVIYDLSVTAGLNSGDEIFGASGFAGIAEACTKSPGNRLKAVYTFWPSDQGGWQNDPLYGNENAQNITMEQGAEYRVEFDVEPFGKCKDLYVVANAATPGTLDSQVIIHNGQNTAETVEYKTKIFKSAGAVNTDGVWHVTMCINGFGDKFKIQFNMLSSDADGANTDKDTGIYLDNYNVYKVAEDEPVEPEPEPSGPEPEIDLNGEYKLTFEQNFDDVDKSVSGSDAMFRATGFAGVADGQLVIDPTGFNGTPALKAVYNFWPTADGSWQKANAYLDSSRTSSLNPDGIYRLKMSIKPFGDWAHTVVAINEPGFGDEFIYLNKDGTIRTESIENGRIITAECGYDEGVYNLTVYLKGTESYLFNYVNMQATDGDTAIANKDTGIMIDDYSFAKLKMEKGFAFNKKAVLYNKPTDGNLTSGLPALGPVTVKIDETALTAEEYTFENSFLTILEGTLGKLENGRHVVAVETGDGESAEMEVFVEDNAMGTVYTTDFAAMPDLKGDQESKDNFFFNSYMDPAAAYSVYTEDIGDNRVVKFVNLGGVTEVFNGIFQFNPREGRLNCLKKERLHSVYIDFKPVNGSLLGVKGYAFDGVDKELFYMELDLAAGLRLDDGVQFPDANWSVESKADGWYRLKISFRYGGEQFTDKAAGYIVFYAPKENADSAWYADNILVESELYPYYVDGNNAYDKATGKTPYYLVDLCRSFEITEVKAGSDVLAENTDYTSETTPLGYTKVILSESFCGKYDLGAAVALSIATSKGNVIEAFMEVVDTTPSLPLEPVNYDKALKGNLEIEVDLSGAGLSKIKLGDNDLIGTEYQMPSEGKIIFKYDYLKDFETGSYVFTVITATGASGTFGVEVKDTTPLFENVPAYEKTSGADYSVPVNLYGKEITSVMFGGKLLTAEQYSYGEGVLTIAGAVFADLPASSYILAVKTDTESECSVEVRDVPPVITGEYTAVQGTDLVVTLDAKGRNIIEVALDDLVLAADEYGYEGGKLTIKGVVLNELAVGSHNLTVKTEGGKAVAAFALNAEGEEDSSEESDKDSSGCFSSMGLAQAGMLALLAAVCMISRKKRDD